MTRYQHLATLLAERIEQGIAMAKSCRRCAA